MRRYWPGSSAITSYSSAIVPSTSTGPRARGKKSPSRCRAPPCARPPMARVAGASRCRRCRLVVRTRSPRARRTACRMPMTCSSATCGCARDSRTWNGPCATRSMRTTKPLHSANDAIRQVTIPRFASVAPRADFESTARMEDRGSRDHAAFFGRLLLLRSRELQKTVNVPHGHHRFVLGRHAHRDLAVARDAAGARRQ